MMTIAHNLRPALASDLAAINNIYNDYVLHSTCTYQEEPETSTAREAWFARHGGPHPVFVAEVDGIVAGWGSLSAYHPRSAYRRTVENSVYIRQDFHRRGLGKSLLAHLIAQARQLRHHAIMAVIDSEQTASIALHHQFHFHKVGHFEQIGYKFDRWLDVVYMELILE